MSRWKKIIIIADDFISLLFPKLCQGCGKPLVRNEKILCTHCMVDIPLTNYHTKRQNTLEKNFYGRCYIEKAAAWAYYRQGGKAQLLIHRLKYKGIRPLGHYMGSLYGNVLKASGFCHDLDCMVAVPLHRAKERKRGFNQSRLIAEGMSNATGIPLIENALERIKSSGTQTRKQRYERWENVEGIFRVVNTGKLEGKHILLIDDVITTGSTIEACAGELLKIKDVKVSVAAMATAEN